MTRPEAPVFYGGQAVIEGVMMRGPDRLAVVVRRPDQSVVVREKQVVPWTERWRVLRLPLLRGAAVLTETLVAGIEALMYSAEAAAGEEEKLSRFEVAVTFLVATVVAILLFLVFPTWLVKHAERLVGSPVVLNLLEGLVRLGVVVGYIVVISRLPDVRRLLQYHGAEHKVIHTWEAGEALTVDNARRHPTVHPRCGTSFLLLLVLVSIVVFAFAGWPNLWERLAVRLAFFPVVAGVAYEVLRFAGRTARRGWPWWLRPLIWPGLQFQRMTTAEPDDAQLEVAIVALQAVQGRGGR